MSNSFYNHGSTPVFRSQGLSSLIRAEFDAITAGFNKLPALSAGVARRLVAVNAAGDALETIFSGYHGAGNPTVLTTNTALGIATLAVNTTGPSNTAIGYQCLTANTTGSSNTAVGTSALAANTTGSSNTAVGVSALPVITTGNNNVGCGNSTLYRLVTGSQNAALGVAALSSVTGNDNVGVGYIAGYRITTGQYNTVVGSQAVAAANVTASGMTAVGYAALAANVSGTGNTAVGYQSLKATTGSLNTAIGYNSLLANTTGDANVAVGYNTLAANTTGQLNVAVGQTALLNNTTGSTNVALGNSAGANSDSGDNNILIGANAAVSLVTGSGNTIIGTDADVTSNAQTNATAIGYQAVATADNQMMFGNASVTTNVFHGLLTFTNYIGSDTDTVLVGLVATGVRLAASDSVGGVMVGYGTTSDIYLSNRDGTRLLTIDSNGAQLIGGTLKTQAGTGTGRPVVPGTLSVNVTPVGNVGLGLQNLMTYSLPANSLVAAGKGVRVRVWGTGANNGNSKTVTLVFGGTTVLTLNLTTGAAQHWEATATIFRYALNSQICFAEGSSGVTTAVPTAGARSFGSGPTETETGAITIACTGNATNNGDILQLGMMVDFIN